MANADSQAHPHAPSSAPNRTSSKRRKIIAQCPTCQHSFTSRHELHAHMANPATHSPVPDSDAISFGELSSSPSSHESSDETCKAPHTPDDAVEMDSNDTTPPSSDAGSPWPNLEDDGFAFADTAYRDAERGRGHSSSTSASGSSWPDLENDGFAFVDADPDPFADAAYRDAGQQSGDGTHANGQPGTERASFDTAHSARRNEGQRTQKEALGVLYCGTCDRWFGNEMVFKRHFMFGARHGEESRDRRDLYYRVWAQTWMDEARGMERDAMDM